MPQASNKEPLFTCNISLPFSLWEKVLAFEADGQYKNTSQAIAALIRHGFIRAHEIDKQYATLYPTVEQDERLK